MTVLLRAMVLAAVLLVATGGHVSADSPCVTMRVTDYASGLRIIAETGSVIAFGFMSGAPGDGVGYILYITPAVCPGLGLDSASSSAGDVQGSVSTLPELLPLP